jgi:YegS/Rv2252/BmrU family lipid kinase
MDVRVPVIVNATSGTQRGSEFSTDLANRFKSTNVDADIRLIEPGNLAAELQRAVAHAPDRIVVGGGDGTVGAAASTLVGTDVALGILPLGTLNHFAKDLHIPLDLDSAVQTIAGGHRLKVDVGSVNGRYFLNNSSLGLYPEVVADRDALRQRLGRTKWRAFASAAVTVFRRYPWLHVRIDVAGTELARRTPFVFVGNNRYEMEGFGIGRRAHLDAGVVSLYVANRTGRLGLLRLAFRALFNSLRQAKDFDMTTAASIQVETHHKQLLVANDGELCWMRTPLQYRVLPAALSVIVPAPAEKP